MKLVVIFFFSVIYLSQGLEINYVPLKSLVDTTVPRKSIEVIDKISLEENDNVIITDIQDIDVNSHGGTLIVTDPTSGLLIKYDYKNGHLITFIKADLSLTDSLINTKPEPITRFKEQFQFLSRKDYPSNGITNKEVAWIANKFFKPKFIDENLILTTTLIYAFGHSGNGKNSCFNRTGLLFVDSSLKLIKYIPFENNDFSFSIPFDFIFNPLKKEVLATSMTESRILFDMKFDSLAGVSRFDINGKLMNVESFLPVCYQRSYLGNDYQNVPSLESIENKVLITYPLDLNLYDNNGISMFKLTNLPFSNDSGFSILRDIRKDFVELYRKNPTLSKFDTEEDFNAKFQDYYLKKNVNSLKKKSLARLFPVKISDLFVNGERIIIWLSVNDTTVKQGYYYVLQEYDITGKLLSQTNIMDDNDNMIKLISFDSHNNYLLLFKKGSEGWTLEKRRWE